VSEWLKHKKIDTKIIEILKKFTGQQLKRLKSLRKEAPDFYYQLISQQNKIDLMTVFLFTEELEKLA
jgi:hypothetical protein